MRNKLVEKYIKSRMRNIAVLMCMAVGITSFQLPVLAGEILDNEEVQTINDDISGTKDRSADNYAEDFVTSVSENKTEYTDESDALSEISENELEQVISEDSASDNEVVAGISGIADPRIVSDSSMKAGQKVTYDCIWFGSYPQAEVVADKSSYTAIPSDILKDGDLIEDAALYSKLQSATYNGSNETTINGTRYRRMKKGDATYLTSSSGYYSWSDSTTYHYFKYEPIKWRVTEKNSDNLLLLADKAVDDRRYNETYTAVTWETCSLRTYLNSTFYDNAFTSAEKAMIKSSTVENANNLYYGTSGGNNTTDKVFLLSEKEVYKTNDDKSFSDSSAKRHGFVDSRGTCDEARRSQASTYARAMGPCWNTSGSYKGNVDWWMRSPGYSSSDATDVSYYGNVNYHGDYVSISWFAARPALKINLSSLTDSMYAGTVCSDGTVNETENPEGIDTSIHSFNMGFDSKFGKRKVDIPVEWGLDYFKQSSEQFNPEMAKVAAVLANTSYFGADNVYSAMNSLGIKKKHKVVHVGSADDKSEGIAKPLTYLGYQDIVFDGEKYNIFCVDVRGSTGVDWVTDFTDGLISFTVTEINIRKELITFMEESTNKTIDELIKDNKHNIFFLVGHSLGGAAVNRLSVNISDLVYPENLFTYTFESPHTCWGHEKPFVAKNYAHNIVDAFDIVPELPIYPGATRYGHDFFFRIEHLRNSCMSQVTGMTLEECSLKKFFTWAFEHHSMDYALTSVMEYIEEEKEGKATVYSSSNIWKKTMLIACPVDVQVYNGDELICESVGDEEKNYSNSAIINVINEKKYVSFYDDIEYEIRLIGTDTGTMDYYEYTYSQESESIEENKKYLKVDLYDGKQMRSTIDLSIVSDYNGDAKNTDTVDDRLFVVNGENEIISGVSSNGIELPVRKLLYDTNGGIGKTPSDNQIYLENDAVTVKGGEDLSKEGYRFAGWTVSKNAVGKVYNANDVFYIHSDTVLYAKWEKKETSKPSEAPSDTPSDMPSGIPTETPSGAPSEAPSSTPTGTPSDTPSNAPESIMLRKEVASYTIEYSKSVSYNAASHIEEGGKESASKTADIIVKVYDSSGNLLTPDKYKVKFKNNKDTMASKGKQPYFTITLKGKVDSATKAAFKSARFEFNINPCDLNTLTLTPTIKTTKNETKIAKLTYMSDTGKKISLKPAKNGKGDYEVVSEDAETFTIKGINNYTGTAVLHK